VFTVKLLGVLAAQPTATAITSGQVVSYKSHSWIIDCGEGFQMKMQKYKISRNKIKAILISHLHGDHVYGLPGLLTSLAIANRTEPLLIVGPEGIQAFTESILKYSHAFLPFDIQYYHCHCLSSESIYEDQYLTIQTIPLEHRVPTVGYVFREKPHRPNLIREQIESLELNVDQIKLLLQNQPITLANNMIINLGEVSTPAKTPRSYAYCSDTIYSDNVIKNIGQVTTLYHESTYMEVDAASAPKWGHSTAKQAATVAKSVSAEQLILGHYSGKYASYDDLLTEAQEIFPNSILGSEGLEVPI
jgi:ribonuclease Z